MKMTTPELQRASRKLKWLFATAVSTMVMSLAQAADPFTGSALYDDVKHYESFGVHRYGTPGANEAMDWIADRLRAAGLTVEDQRFTMDRQYFLDAATLKVGDKSLSVLPQWWIPPQQASFELTAPIAASGESQAQFVWLRLPYDRGAYLNDKHRAVIAGVMSRHPAAVLMSIDHPSGEIFTYNVAQTDAPWPVPVILVAPKDAALLDAAEQAGTPVTVSVKGHYGKDVAGRNVIGHLDRGADRTIVISTPVTSWFTSSCERGPGIATFLAIASMAAQSLDDANFVFVATAGHEIGHGGMELFIDHLAPKPQAVAAWLHLGASLACYRRVREDDRWIIVPEVDSKSRYLGLSASLAPTIEPALRDLAAIRMVGDKAAVGELRNIYDAGYPNFFGMFGIHPLFHTTLDSADMTGPAALEAVARPLGEALRAVVGKPR